MRILKVANIPNTRSSGMGRVMHCTADELRLLGHEVDLLFAEDVPGVRSRATERFRFPVALVGAVRRRLRAGARYDVVEIHEPSAAAYCFARKLDRSLPPCVVMSHGLEELQWNLRRQLHRTLGERTSLKSRILVPTTRLTQVRYGLRHAAQVMCLNSMDEAFLRDVSRLKRERISRVRHGVAPGFFRERPAVRARGCRMLYVGSWLPHKGSRFLDQAFPLINAACPDARLSILGTGVPDEQVLSGFPEQLRPLIEVRSAVDDHQLAAAYASHEVFLQPSYYESWGLASLEAAAAGMAIASASAGGPRDYLRDGTTAMLVPQAEPAALAGAAIRLARDPELRARLGSAAQEQARELTWRAAAQSHLHAYCRALGVPDPQELLQRQPGAPPQGTPCESN